MNRLRTINEAYNYLKTQDPDTCITPYFLRRMIVDGQVPSLKAGKKYLVDIDAIMERLSQKMTALETPESPAPGFIQPIPERIKFT